MHWVNYIKENRLQLSAATVALLLIVFNIIRMLNVSITYDEASTYQYYILPSWHDIINNNPPTANNHFLNSLLAKFFVTNIHDSLFIIRLPNLIGQAVYLLYSYLLAKKILNKPIWIFTLFLLLQLNPFLFDFWGLSRGYGLAIGCMLGSIYYLILYLQQFKIRSIILSSAFMILGVYANFSILNYTMAFFAVLLLHLLLRRNTKTAINTLATIFASTIAIYFLIGKQIIALREAKQLYFGGTSDFIRDSVGTLVQDSLFLSEHNAIIYPVSIAVVILTLCTAGYWLVILIKKQVLAIYGIAFCLLLLVPVLSTIIQHHLFDTPYLIARTALFFYPLFILCIIYTLYHIPIFQHAVFLPVILSVVFIVNFTINLNFKSTRSWNFDQHTPWILERMVTTKKNNGKIKLNLDWHLSGSFRYLVVKYYPNQFDYLEGYNETSFEKTAYDFYMIKSQDASRVPDTYILDTAFSDNQYHLYKRKLWDND